MSAKPLHPAVAELLDSRRLGQLGRARHRFTVSREEGLLRLREQTRGGGEGRWDWTLLLVRAAVALSELAEARVEIERVETKEGALRVLTFDVITPLIELDALDLSDLLAGALAPDLGLPFTPEGEGEGPREELEPDLRLARFRVLIGRALNAALAYAPISIELETSAGGRRFERREQAVEGRDPYLERKLRGLATPSRFVLRVTEAQPGLSSRLGRWLRGRGEVHEQLTSLWGEHRLVDAEGSPLGEDGELSLGPALTREPVAFGRLARYGGLAGVEAAPSRLRSSVWLVREGVTLLDLGPALAEQGLDPLALAGWVDCPQLRLSADERGVVRDASLEALVAWLHDYQTRADGTGALAWPSSLREGVQAANADAITIDQLAEAAHSGRELVYVWRHQAGAVPAWTRGRIAALWPSEELLLRTRLPELRLVPLRALGQTDVDPADLSSLRQSCFDPMALVKDSPLEAAARVGGAASTPADTLAESLRVSVEAFVHRAPTASNGFIVILAYERRVAQIHETGKVFSGVTLVCRVHSEGPTLDVAALRRDVALVARIAEHSRAQARAHWEALLGYVMSRSSAWENPLLRAALLELSASTLELRYQHSSAGLRLAWRDSVLLDVEIGHEAKDAGGRKSAVKGEPKQLRDALHNVRERGFVLVAHPHKHYSPLRSQDPLLQPWLLAHDNARGLLVRIVGQRAVLDMPVVPEAHPLVREEPVEDQRHLLREAATIERERLRSSTDPLARQRLLGHLLVARGLGLDGAYGLDKLALLERYDPRAQHPTRLVSLAAAQAERPRPGLVPPGAVHRGLARPMLEVLPGVAALLAEVGEFEPGATAVLARSDRPVLDVRGVERSAATPVRRRGRALAPLLVRSVVDPLLYGRLEVAGDLSRTRIGLWSKGLRVGEIELHEPLRRVSGRLVLTAPGQRVGAEKIRERVTHYAHELLADAPRQRSLLPPGQTQREHLDHFVEYVRAALRVEDRYDLGEVFGLRTGTEGTGRLLALREMSLRAAPLRPLARHREALLAGSVRQSLAMAVHFDTALLSWRPVKLAKRRHDGSFELEFGLRNTWIQRGLDESRELSPEAHRHAALFAAVLVVASFFEQAREREDTRLGVEHLHVALWRLLELSQLV